ncbi:hypothetical protein H5410_014023 [Solanum commersonii]|uniref:Uncharacterized protein n=1 Tax=Solanum commersonii TaxID=4109 RepID=A0A9J5ZQ82_SOLCO|nr:hypothetical protein H5410_014023 [Solanum commersonii]
MYNVILNTYFSNTYPFFFFQGSKQYINLAFEKLEMIGFERIVLARPLYHIQYPFAYLSHLRRILPIAQCKLYFRSLRRFCRDDLANTCALGGHRPLLPDSDLKALSHNPANGSFAPLAFQPNAMINCVNQWFLSRTGLNYYCDTIINREEPTSKDKKATSLLFCLWIS